MLVGIKKRQNFLRNNDVRKDDFTKGNAHQFYVRLPENFDHTKTFTGKKMLTTFWSTYFCKHAFSVTNYRKSKFYSRLADKTLARDITPSPLVTKQVFTSCLGHPASQTPLKSAMICRHPKSPTRGEHFL